MNLQYNSIFFYPLSFVEIRVMNQYRISTQTIKIRYRYTLTCEDGLE